MVHWNTQHIWSLFRFQLVHQLDDDEWFHSSAWTERWSILQAVLEKASTRSSFAIALKMVHAWLVYQKEQEGEASHFPLEEVWALLESILLRESDVSAPERLSYEEALADFDERSVEQLLDPFLEWPEPNSSE